MLQLTLHTTVTASVFREIYSCRHQALRLVVKKMKRLVLCLLQYAKTENTTVVTTI